tara:strand:- start:30423 stop:30608 length:186 start_codon:yes stop_codon:yes gene_type:complete
MIKYLSVGVNPPPLDTKIIVKKSVFDFDDGAKIVELNGKDASLDWHICELISSGHTLWTSV